MFAVHRWVIDNEHVHKDWPAGTREYVSSEEFDRLMDLLQVTRTELVRYIGDIPGRRFAIGKLIDRIDRMLERNELGASEGQVK